MNWLGVNNPEVAAKLQWLKYVPKILEESGKRRIF
jgi:hypothetical protein